MIRDRKAQTFSVEVEEDAASDFYSQAMKLKIQPDKPGAPEMIWKQKLDSELEDEMQELKEELEELKKEMQELREKLK